MNKVDESERIVLEWLARPTQNDSRLAMLLHDDSRNEVSRGRRVGRRILMEAVWSLLSRRMVYLDFSQSSATNWDICLTEKGRKASDDAHLNPDNVSAYLQHVASRVGELDSVAMFYLEESLRCYANECYTASTMMLGVAAEAMFYEVATVFSIWLGNKSGKILSQLLEAPAKSYVQKFIEFQKRIAANKGHLPSNLQQNLDLNINAVLELLRIARNDVGHPTGIVVEQDSAFQYLVLFPSLAKRLKELKLYFESNSLTSDV
jgi:hypothetical protein